MRFKPGDKVIRTRHPHPEYGMKIGDIYTVAKFDCWGYMALKELPGEGSSWDPQYFSLAEIADFELEFSV